MLNRVLSIAGALAAAMAAVAPATAQAHRDSARVARLSSCPDDYLGLQLTHLSSHGGGLDFGLYTVPSAMAEGMAIFLPQLSYAATKPIGDSWFISKIGVWGAFAAGSGGSGGIVGAQAGLGVLARTGRSSALRIEIGPQVALVAPTDPVFVVSMGIASLQPR